MSEITSNPKLSGLSRFTSAQRDESLSRLREAAYRLFARSGYLAVSIDDITREAGFTRKTFYRHFGSKSAIALDLLGQETERYSRVWAELDAEDSADPKLVARWLDRLLDRHTSGGLLRTYIEAGFADEHMAGEWRNVVPNLIVVLGERIPAFAFADGTSADPRRYGQAYLVVHQIIIEFSSVASGIPGMDRHLLCELLAERFCEFVETARSARQTVADVPEPQAESAHVAELAVWKKSRA